MRPDPRVAEMRAQGMTVMDIAAELNIAASTVTRYLDALQVPRTQVPGARKRRTTGERPALWDSLSDETLIREYGKGDSTLVLAARYGVHHATVHRRLVRLGVVRTVQESVKVRKDARQAPRLAPGSLRGLAAELRVDAAELLPVLYRNGFLVAIDDQAPPDTPDPGAA